MAFECLVKCGLCCGCVPIPVPVWLAHQDKLQTQPVKVTELSNHTVFPETESGYCVFLNVDKKCVIYEDRPPVCREFGVSANVLLQCPFLKPNGKPRSEASQKQFLRKNGKFSVLRKRGSVKV